MTKYVVDFERDDESGHWLASVPAVPGCHTYGRTLEQARERVREALGLWVEDAETASLEDNIKMPVAAKKSVQSWLKAKAEAEFAEMKAQRTAAAAAHQLTSKWALSFRDAGDLMGVSRQRVQQIAVRESPGRNITARAKRAAKKR